MAASSEGVCAEKVNRPNKVIRQESEGMGVWGFEGRNRWYKELFHLAAVRLLKASATSRALRNSPEVIFSAISGVSVK
jgi:hypothetical protein